MALASERRLGAIGKNDDGAFRHHEAQLSQRFKRIGGELIDIDHEHIGREGVEYGIVEQGDGRLRSRHGRAEGGGYAKNIRVGDVDQATRAGQDVTLSDMTGILASESKPNDVPVKICHPQLSTGAGGPLS